MNRRIASFAWLVIPLVVGCDTLASGRKYTLTKVASDASLVPAHEKIDPGTSRLEKVPSNLSVVLKDGFIRYLESIGRPEVAVFSRVKIRSPQDPEEALVWEEIFLMSEDPDDQMVLNQDSFLPRKDIPLLPAIAYNGKDEIYVSLRIVELDQNDNENLRSLVNSAATVAATLRPDVAVGASTFQTVLTFLTKNNPDDIEFQFDFALIPGCDESVIEVHGREQYMVLPPRVGRYVVVKTEHQHRLVYPNGYFDAAHEGLRYGLGSLLKLATLGFFNWGIWVPLAGADPEDDFYMKLFGRPFATDGGSWRLPQWQDGKLVFPWSGGEIGVQNDSLVYRETNAGQLFLDQGYLVLAIIDSKEGIDVEKLRLANEAKESIDSIVSTGQPTPDEFRDALQELSDGLLKSNYEDQLSSKLDQLLQTAKTTDEVEAALRAIDGDLGELSDGLQESLRPKLLKVAGARHREVGGDGNLAPPELLEKVLLLDAESKATLTFRKGAANRLEVASTIDLEITRKSTLSTDLAPFSVKVKSPLATAKEFEISLTADGERRDATVWLVPKLDARVFLQDSETGEEEWEEVDQIPRAGQEQSLRLELQGKVGGASILLWLKAQGITAGVKWDGINLASELDDKGRLNFKLPPTRSSSADKIVITPAGLAKDIKVATGGNPR